MPSFRHPMLAQCDNVNDSIWLYHHSNTSVAPNSLDSNKFGLSHIQNEIATGCSPVPDILSEGFGVNPSVLFVSTVYGFVYDYLKTTFNRNEMSWQGFIEKFYRDIIQRDMGIYRRLNDIYELVSEHHGIPMDFCFTELVKTVLISPRNTVSGLDTGDTFLRYFVQHELPFLQHRLAKIEGKCLIFTFTDIATFFTIAALSNMDIYDVESLPQEIEVLHQDGVRPVYIKSLRNRKGALQININAGDSFSSSVAFQTVFKVREKEIYIVPLPHPSSANNGMWAQHGEWKLKVRELLRQIV